ncbi:MAG: glycosyltransferase family 9 protein [Desulfobacterales bacterium]|nr:glycosyltransferase family 9 protein [Desulfobacterales bacterium]
MDTPTEKLVIVKPGALGDTLLLAPALRALREGRPEMEIAVAGSLPAAGLLKYFGLAEAVFDIECLNLYAPAGAEIKILRGARVLACLPLDADGCAALRDRAGVASIKVCPARERKVGQHMAVYLHQCLKGLIPGTGKLSHAPLACPDGATIRPAELYAVLAPGAGSAAKCAPLNRFEAAAREWHARGVLPVFLAGEVEIDRGLAAHYPDRFPCIATPSLTALAGLMKGAVAVCANDSGPAHLAGLLGAPTTVYFGPTDPDVWRPWGPRVVVRRFKSINKI